MSDDELVLRAFREHADLSHAEMRALVTMILNRNRNPRPHYEGGWEVVAGGLGYEVPEPPAHLDTSADAAEVRKRRDSIYRNTRRTIRSLRDKGAIRTVSTGGWYGNSLYAILPKATS
jgi:hypothetical protein